MTERLNLPGYIYSTAIPAEPRFGFDGILIVATDGTYHAIRYNEAGHGRSLKEAVANIRPIEGHTQFREEYHAAFWAITQRLEIAKSIDGRGMLDMMRKASGVKITKEPFEWQRNCLR